MDTDPLVESHNSESAHLAAVSEEARQKANKAQMAEVVREVIEQTAPLASFEKIGSYIDTSIEKSIRTNVNGKIDKMQRGLDTHNEKHELDMSRMMPLIEAFESGQRDLASARKGGRMVLWVAGAITAIGGAWLIIIQVIASLKLH